MIKNISFIGLGHMGAPMAANLIKAGYTVKIYDLNPQLMSPLVEQGAIAASSILTAIIDAEVVITMLPAGEQVLAVYLGAEGILDNINKQALLIDCSTIEMDAAKSLHAAASFQQLALLDAPVSGGTKGAAAKTLTFMVGGDKRHYERALPVFENMGKKILYAGAGGSGQAAKICNNMLLGISMIAVSEAFHLADKLGLDAQTFFDIASVSSGECWALTNYCPVPGPVPTTPANRGYEAGFAVKMMQKDLRLAQQAASSSGANTPLGAGAFALYNTLSMEGLGEKDFSMFYEWLVKQK